MKTVNEIVADGMERCAEIINKPTRIGSACKSFFKTVNADIRAIEKFKETIDLNPEHAFEWAESEMQSAANLSFACKICLAMAASKAETQEQRFLNGCEAIRNMLREELLDNRFRPASTSVSSNAMRLCHIESASRMLRFLNPICEGLGAQ